MRVARSTSGVRQLMSEARPAGSRPAGRARLRPASRVAVVALLAVFGVVAACAPSPGSNSPVVSGEPKVGATLQVSRGDWRFDPTSYRYEWQSCTSPTGGCTPVGDNSSSYIAADADEGRYLRASVTASNSAGSARQVSASVGPITSDGNTGDDEVTQVIEIDGDAVSVSVPAGLQLEAEQADLAQLPSLPAHLAGPAAALRLSIGGVSTGAIVTVAIKLAHPTGAYAKLLGEAWDEFEFDGVTGATLSADGRTITLRLQDGGRGDTDGVANGQIMDPVVWDTRPPTPDSTGFITLLDSLGQDRQYLPVPNPQASPVTAFRGSTTQTDVPPPNASFNDYCQKFDGYCYDDVEAQPIYGVPAGLRTLVLWTDRSEGQAVDRWFVWDPATSSYVGSYPVGPKPCPGEATGYQRFESGSGRVALIMSFAACESPDDGSDVLRFAGVQQIDLFTGAIDVSLEAPLNQANIPAVRDPWSGAPTLPIYAWDPSGPALILLEFDSQFTKFVTHTVVGSRWSVSGDVERRALDLSAPGDSFCVPGRFTHPPVAGPGPDEVRVLALCMPTSGAGSAQLRAVQLQEFLEGGSYVDSESTAKVVDLNYNYSPGSTCGFQLSPVAGESLTPLTPLAGMLQSPGTDQTLVFLTERRSPAGLAPEGCVPIAAYRIALDGSSAPVKVADVSPAEYGNRSLVGWWSTAAP